MEKIHVIPKSSERFMSVSINNCWTLTDSWSFLSSPLDTLVSNLGKDHKFPLLRQSTLVRNENGDVDEEKVGLLLGKGVYPYEYAQSYRDLTNCTDFPPHKCFYSQLKEKNISLAEYEKGKKVFSKFECKNLAEYMDVYCELDVLLLGMYTKKSL